MTINHLASLGIFLLGGPVVVLAQVSTPEGSITASLVQLGVVGVILAWLTMVDIPARNKAGADREVVWQKQLEFERTSNASREASFQASLAQQAASLADIARSKAELARVLAELSDELREDRATRRG